MSTQKQEKLVLWFEELTKGDIPLAGGKNANLGEMTQAKVPVPPGFAITAYSYKRFITETQIAREIYRIIDETVTDPEDNVTTYTRDGVGLMIHTNNPNSTISEARMRPRIMPHSMGVEGNIGCLANIGAVTTTPIVQK